VGGFGFAHGRAFFSSERRVARGKDIVFRFPLKRPFVRGSGSLAQDCPLARLGPSEPAKLVAAVQRRLGREKPMRRVSISFACHGWAVLAFVGQRAVTFSADANGRKLRRQ
jgi:hypothetical protein